MPSHPMHHCGVKVALMLVAAIATSQGWLENRLHGFLLPEHDCGRPERNKWITAFYFHTAQSSSYHLLYPHPPAESRVTTTNPRLDEAQTMGCSTAGTTRMLCISQLTQRSAHHQNERTTFHARNHPPDSEENYITPSGGPGLPATFPGFQDTDLASTCDLEPSRICIPAPKPFEKFSVECCAHRMKRLTTHPRVSSKNSDPDARWRICKDPAKKL